MGISTTEKLAIIAVGVLFVMAAYFFNEYADVLRGIIFLRGISGILIYVVGGAIAIIIAPLTFLPFLPAAVALWGELVAALLSIVAWGGGAAAAFGIGRRWGQPLVTKLVSLERIERIEDILPQRHMFWGVVLLRLLLPVDILSYALALFTRMRFWPYFFATLVGIVPFAFLFAYLSAVPLSLQIVALVIGVLVVFAGYGRAKKLLRKTI